MPGITAVLHTSDDALRVGRVLETLFSCDEIIVVDHSSRDGTPRIARQYGARVYPYQPGCGPGHFLQMANHDWILCLDPHEALTEALEATLLEWKSFDPSTMSGVPAFAVFLREETEDGWVPLPLPQTRVVPRGWTRWKSFMPADVPEATALEGELLRFILP